MTFLLWLYQFIGAVFLGFMISAEVSSKSRPSPVECMLILGLAVIWPYSFWLIYKQEVKS